MAITKLCGILSTRQVKKLTFASVNRSPHCIQLHYIKNEIERVMDISTLPTINNIIIDKNQIYNIDEDAIALSKNLIELSNITKIKKRG